jgi:hypothetical protein
VFVRDDTMAFDTWVTALAFCDIPPLGIIRTTAQGVWMFRAPQRNIYDVTRLFQPGHGLFLWLGGPAPRNLVPPESWQHFVLPPGPGQHLHELPLGTRNSDEARDAANWVE